MCFQVENGQAFEQGGVESKREVNAASGHHRNPLPPLPQIQEKKERGVCEIELDQEFDFSMHLLLGTRKKSRQKQQFMQQQRKWVGARDLFLALRGENYILYIFDVVQTNYQQQLVETTNKNPTDTHTHNTHSHFYIIHYISNRSLYCFEAWQHIDIWCADLPEFFV